ncbi:MAG: NAD(P)H-dependent dehydrogenase/reductase [Chlorobi bacterium]|nr:NAD(P)H-dependent dehydrogenase/reductase [Chlorobiota bacterium]
MTNLYDLMHTRRSIRKFSTKPVEKEKIDRILKAALLAPSGKRTYPAEFIVVDDRKTLEAIASSKTHGAAFIKEAPLAIVIVADTSKYDVWIEDSAIAAAFILLAAENEGLGACWSQLRQRTTADGKTATQNLKNILNLKPEHELLSVIAIGYKAEKKPPHTDESIDTGRVYHNRFA